ncbi:hypothetical protein D3C85_1496890 [compost metagenome]
MAGLGGQAGKRAVADRCRWRRADKAPEHTQQHYTQQYQTDAFVQVGSVFAPWAVVVQAHHPQAQAEQAEYSQSNTPVQDDADKAITRR